jgi:pimeloyl-ACP methyl ester carboxylesterase
MEFKPTYGIVHNEGCDIHYWYQGKGPLITFVPGGNGHGRQYNKIMAALSDRFTCVTFDRRQMSSSLVKGNKPLNPIQQCRDILAVIKSIGFSKTILFGSSLGGVLGFQFAIDHPDVVDHLICHEAPTSTLLPDSSEMLDWVFRLVELRDTVGIGAAAKEFRKSFVGYDDEGVPSTTPPEPHNEINFWENEFYPATTYCPDLRKLLQSKTSVGLMTGMRSRDAFYARTTYEQEKILGCIRADVPGHHQGFEVETEAFLPHFIEMLENLEKRRANNA